MDNQEDENKLRDILSKQEKAIFPMKRALFSFGGTGAAKSTFTNIAVGRTLTIIDNREYGQAKMLPPLISSNNLQSCTKYPVVVESVNPKGVYVIDGPGDDDTGDKNTSRDIQRIANIYYNYKVPLLTDELTFLYIAPFATLEVVRCQLFSRSLEVFANMITDANIFKNSFSILITKIPTDETKEYIVI